MNKSLNQLIFNFKCKRSRISIEGYVV